MKNKKLPCRVPKELLAYICFWIIWPIATHFILPSSSSLLQQAELKSEVLPLSSMHIMIGSQLVRLSIVICLILYFKNSLKDIGFRTTCWWKDLILGLGVFGIMIIVPVLFGSLISILPDQAKMAIPMAMPQHNLQSRLLWITVSICNGIGEETAFRGYGWVILNKYLKRPWISALVISLIFSVGHYYMGIIPVISIFIVALILQGIFIWRKSLLPTIIGHTLYDSLLCFV